MDWGQLGFLALFKLLKVTFGLLNAKMLGWATINLLLGLLVGQRDKASTCLFTEQFVAIKHFQGCQCGGYFITWQAGRFSLGFPLSHGTAHSYEWYHLKCWRFCTKPNEFSRCSTMVRYMRTGNFSCFGSFASWLLLSFILLNSLLAEILTHNFLISSCVSKRAIIIFAGSFQRGLSLCFFLWI